MAKFIKCSIEQATYKGQNIKNNPINIELVTQVAKDMEKWYPDNHGTPSIVFKGIDVVWIYQLNQEKTRDLDYENIVNNNFDKE